MANSKLPSVLMFGWEFPPFNSGGLGVACEGLSKALSASGVDLTFVLPMKVPVSISWCKFVFADEESEVVDEKQIRTLFSGYQSHGVSVSTEMQRYGLPSYISGSLMQRVQSYASSLPRRKPQKNKLARNP